MVPYYTGKTGTVWYGYDRTIIYYVTGNPKFWKKRQKGLLSL